MATIMVQLAEYDWTLRALHSACPMARTHQTDVTLVRMVPVQHFGWLGSELAHAPLAGAEYETLLTYTNTVESYGTKLTIQTMQYTSLIDALVEAAHHLDAVAVFAVLPQSSFPLWQKFKTWDFHRRLPAQHYSM